MWWRESWLFNLIADWQSKPVTSWKSVVVGCGLLANVLVGVYWSVASPKWTDRGGAFVVSVLALLGSVWFFREGKA